MLSIFRSWTTEYKSNFQSFNNYQYDKGAWKGAAPPHVRQQMVINYNLICQLLLIPYWRHRHMGYILYLQSVPSNVASKIKPIFVITYNDQ